MLLYTYLTFTPHLPHAYHICITSLPRTYLTSSRLPHAYLKPTPAPRPPGTRQSGPPHAQEYPARISHSVHAHVLHARANKATLSQLHRHPTSALPQPNGRPPLHLPPNSRPPFDHYLSCVRSRRVRKERNRPNVVTTEGRVCATPPLAREVPCGTSHTTQALYRFPLGRDAAVILLAHPCLYLFWCYCLVLCICRTALLTTTTRNTHSYRTAWE